MRKYVIGIINKEKPIIFNVIIVVSSSYRNIMIARIVHVMITLEKLLYRM